MLERSEADEEEIAHRKALLILSHREHSTAELRKKLRMRDFPEWVIDPVLTRLKRLGLLDDSRFSEAFVREKVRNKPMGRKGLLMELVMKRGVPEDVARRAIVSVMNDEQIREEDLARSVVRKKHIDGWRNIAGMLRRRGFDEGVISAVLEDRIEES